MPDELTRKKYSMDPHIFSQDEEEMTQETKQNNAILSEWEEIFSDTDSKEYRRLGRGSSGKRNRRNRRASSIFSPRADFMRTNEEVSDTTDRPSPSKSPSTVISENMALLKMSSVQPSNEVCATTTDDTRGERTWEHVIDLGGINATGAACISSITNLYCSPLQLPVSERAATRFWEETTTDVNLEDMSTLGAALGESNFELSPQVESSKVSDHFDVRSFRCTVSYIYCYLFK
jgi:hypothetical protein